QPRGGLLFVSVIQKYERQAFGFNFSKARDGKSNVHGVVLSTPDYRDIVKSFNLQRLRVIKLLTLASPGNGFPRLPFGRPAAFSLPLVPGLFSLGQSNLTFYPAVLEIHASGNQGVTALLCFAHQLAQLCLVKQQFARSQRSMMRVTGILVSSNVRISQP